MREKAGCFTVATFKNVKAYIMQQVDFRAKIDGKIQAAFVIFYALDGKPWANYKTDDPKKAQLTDITVPTCLFIHRADGQLGFIGGKNDPGESLEDTAIREVEEEVGHKIAVALDPIVAHALEPVTTHAFAAEVSYEELRKIQRDAETGIHFGAELTGLTIPHLVDYDRLIGKGGGIVRLLQNNLAPSVREELVHFLLKKEIFTNDALADICQRAGFDLEQLLA